MSIGAGAAAAQGRPSSPTGRREGESASPLRRPRAGDAATTKPRWVRSRRPRAGDRAPTKVSFDIPDVEDEDDEYDDEAVAAPRTPHRFDVGDEVDPDEYERVRLQGGKGKAPKVTGTKGTHNFLWEPEIPDGVPDWPVAWQGKFVNAELLAKGSYGSVYKCKVKDEDKHVAVKIIDIDNLGDLGSVKLEIENLKRFGGGDVVTFYDAISQTDYSHRTRIFLLMEAADGDLDEVLTKGLDRVSMKERLKIATQMVRGLYKFAKEGFVHRDVKPGNVLVFGDPTSPKGCRVKLADLGIASGQHMLAPNEGVVGSRWYIAPEVWKKHGSLRKSDVWSAGIVLYELFLGHLPDSFLQANLLRDSPKVNEDPLQHFIPNEFNIKKDEAFLEFKREDPQVARVISSMLTKRVWLRASMRSALAKLRNIARDRGIEVPMPEYVEL